MTSKYVFDTYAIIEILRGSKAYTSFTNERADIVINNFIFAELCYNLSKEKHPRTKETLEKYSRYIKSVKPEWIREAMEFRLQWKDRGVSITDCISYIMAKRIGVRFLTGDKEFEGLDDVEFVK